MSDREKTYLYIVLLVLSIVLALYMRSTIGENFVRSLGG